VGWVTAFKQVNCLTTYPAAQANSAFHPSEVSKWVPAIAEKAKAGMAHSVCRCTCGCEGKTVKSPENMCQTWALPRWCFTKRRYIKCTYLSVYLYTFYTVTSNTCLTAIFQDNLVSQYQNATILDFIGAKDDGSGGDNCSDNMCKHQSNRHHQHTNNQLFKCQKPFISLNQQWQNIEGK